MTLRLENDLAGGALSNCVVDERSFVVARFQEWKEADAYVRWMNEPTIALGTLTALHERLREAEGIAEARRQEIERLGEKMAELQVNCDGWRAECGAHDRRMAQAVDRLRDRMAERDQAEAGREKAIAALKAEREKATNKEMARVQTEGELCCRIDRLVAEREGALLERDQARAELARLRELRGLRGPGDFSEEKARYEERIANYERRCARHEEVQVSLRNELEKARRDAELSKRISEEWTKKSDAARAQVRDLQATIATMRGACETTNRWETQRVDRPVDWLSQTTALAAEKPAPDPSQGIIVTYEKDTGKNGVWTAFPKGGPGAKLWVADFCSLRHARGFASWLETGVFAAPTEKPPRYRVRKHADEWLVDDHEYPTAVTAVRSVGHMVASFIREGAEERARAWADAENAK